MLSKEQEFELLEKTIGLLPESYLKDILVEERRAIQMAITSDLCYLGLAHAQREEQRRVHNLAEDMKSAQARLSQIQTETAALERRAREARESIEESQSLARQILSVHYK